MSFRASWLALESNPEAVNSFLEKLGITSLDCTDIISFDEEMQDFIPKPQHAVIFCFPCGSAAEYREQIYKQLAEKEHDSKSKDVFFMKQKIQNACGTFALFHALANLEDKVDLGNGPFRKFLDEAKLGNEESRSELLEKNDGLATAHSETASAGETEQPEASNVNFHFICYVSRNGILYEIDSSTPFPRSLGTTTPETLVTDAWKYSIKEYTSRTSNPSFSAMLLTDK